MPKKLPKTNTATIHSCLSDPFEEFEELYEELDAWLESLGERGLGESNKYYEVEEAVNLLNDITDPIDESLFEGPRLGEFLDRSVTYPYNRPSSKGYLSRAKRCDNAANMLSAAFDALSELVEKLKAEQAEEASIEQAEEALEELDRIRSVAYEIEFPRMMG